MKSRVETHAREREMVEGREGKGGYVEWGGFTVAFETYPKGGKDWAPFFRGLPDDRCQSPHWGFVIKGKMTIGYKDHDETIKAGEAYYLAPGHLPLRMAKGTKIIEFSPKAEYDKTIGVTSKNREATAAKGKS